MIRNVGMQNIGFGRLISVKTESNNKYIPPTLLNEDEIFKITPNDEYNSTIYFKNGEQLETPESTSNVLYNMNIKA
ncbi:MAG TPA: hypothetical protein DDW90_07380 [Cyanobacteria bacterium UBA9971]|nr:hypothetical protein [Cyanobacteria bacterium UBA9971]